MNTDALPTLPLQDASRLPALGAPSAAAVLDEIVRLSREWIQVHEQETTKRAQIKADSDVDLSEISARRDLFLAYLDKSFDERARNFEKLFERLDRAMTSQPQAVGDILASITSLALKSPFADLRDPVALRRKLGDRDAEWDV